MTFGRSGLAPPGVRSSSEVLREQYEFNTLTQAYRSSEREAAYQAEVAASRAARMMTDEERLVPDRAGFNIVSHESKAPIPENSLAFLDTPVDRDRVTANHSSYDFDVITGCPKPAGHESLDPAIRAGLKPPAQTAEDAGVPAKAYTAPTTATARSYNILTGHITSRTPGPDALPPHRGKRRIPTSHHDDPSILVWHNAPTRQPPPPHP